MIQIEIQQEAAKQRAADLGVPLVTPDTPSPVREAICAVAALVSPLTLDQVRDRVSFYLPGIAGDIWNLVPAPLRDLLRQFNIDLSKTGCVYLSPLAWSCFPLATVAHELSHRNRDSVVRASGGIIASVLWSAGYLIHPTIRGWEEGTCHVNDLVSSVIVNGRNPDMAANEALDGVAIYNLTPEGRAIYQAAIESAAASLKAGALPGDGTEVQEILKICKKLGAKLGAWSKVID